ncbi:MAG: aminomethyl-transferring glycine dehydrogenase [Bacteroidetes bacterium]|nr:aminomethyl-transferring glycine dehydrogenase [Bacteroidota bacterium]
MSNYQFTDRHIGPDTKETQEMLLAIGVASIEELISKTIPKDIRLKKDNNTPPAQDEATYLRELRAVAAKNKIFRTYIGLGYHNTIIPGVIQRNIFENPGWYTAYTPYQAEIAQGRLEALLNFQTMVVDLTGMELANASLLDESTAAAEGMNMLFHTRTKEQEKAGCTKFFISEETFPQTIDVLRTRATPLGIQLVTGDVDTFKFGADFFGALLQYPGKEGNLRDYTGFTSKCKEKDIRVVVAADIMSLVLLTPPGEWGADVVVGSTQRFGVPMGYGGPHAAFFATKESYKRDLPGRIIGVSIDASGKPALRMALQTREQHIKRDKATSNICTAQVLLAVMASMYAVYHGPRGLKAIAGTIHQRAVSLVEGLKKIGMKVIYDQYFDTVAIDANGKSEAIRKLAEAAGMNFRYESNGNIVINVDETTLNEDISEIISVFAKANNFDYKRNGVELSVQSVINEKMPLARKSDFLTNIVFNKYRSETDMLRYIKHLENKDLALNHSMIALGSCTMKLNATSEMMPLSWPLWNSIHPFAPVDQAQGYAQIIEELEAYLCEITGFDAVSLQPNSGAQGEYAGLMAIRGYLEAKGEGHRNVCLIPQSAHGTNPASAVMAGWKIVVVKCDENGNIDLTDLRTKAELYKTNLAAAMVTYPSTHGVYEEGIRELTKIIHDNGGQVYMDGANMNAQVGLTSPGMIGADVCHLNLHKTFAIPHGGGGPGMGPIGVAKHLAPYLSNHPVINVNKERTGTAVSAAPWGSALILLISYGYIRMLGNEGIRKATEYAIFNANYMKARLEGHYPILYKGKNGSVAHEMILDCRAFKQSAGIEAGDIAKRLMDYGFHAPTVAFPVAGTLMVEPTESESKEELDRFCDAMISIREEIRTLEIGTADKHNNPLINAPHTVAELTADEWNYPYSRKEAAWPAPWLVANKFWPSVKRVDNAYGDRNLVCSCPDVSSYEEAPMHS